MYIKYFWTCINYQIILKCILICNLESLCLKEHVFRWKVYLAFRKMHFPLCLSWRFSRSKTWTGRSCNRMERQAFFIARNNFRWNCYWMKIFPSNSNFVLNNGFDVYTIRDMQWLGTENGELLQLMLNNDFTTFITIDNKYCFSAKFHWLSFAGDCAYCKG